MKALFHYVTRFLLSRSSATERGTAASGLCRRFIGLTLETIKKKRLSIRSIKKLSRIERRENEVGVYAYMHVPS